MNILKNNWFTEMNTILNFWIYTKSIPQSNNFVLIYLEKRLSLFSTLNPWFKH